MKPKFISESSSEVSRLSRSSHSIIRKNFSSLPRLITSRIFKNLDFEDKISMRQSSFHLRSHVDDHIRRQFVKWKMSLKQSEKLTCEKILLLSIEQVTELNFNPPYLIKLIERTGNIAAYADSIWKDFDCPIRIEKKEKLLQTFYEDTITVFDDRDKKILFTLTLLRMLKVLSGSKVKKVHPFNRKNALRVEFTFTDICFMIPCYNYVYNWFSFDRDWISVLLLFTKFLEIKAAVQQDENVTWVNLIRPINFENTSMIIGRKNPLRSRTKTPAKVSCYLRLDGDQEMIKSIEDFLETDEFDWTKVADKLHVSCKFTSHHTKIGRFINKDLVLTET